MVEFSAVSKEADIAEGEELGPSLPGHLGVFTAPHSEKEGTDQEECQCRGGRRVGEFEQHAEE